MRDNSKCRKVAYCDFKPVIDDTLVQVEICQFCGKRVIYNKYDGRIDNNKYLKDHIRITCQPTGATAKVFEQVYRVDRFRYARQLLGNKRKNKVDEMNEYAAACREAKVDYKTTVL